MVPAVFGVPEDRRKHHRKTRIPLLGNAPAGPVDRRLDVGLLSWRCTETTDGAGMHLRPSGLARIPGVQWLLIPSR